MVESRLIETEKFKYAPNIIMYVCELFGIGNVDALSPMKSRNRITNAIISREQEVLPIYRETAFTDNSRIVRDFTNGIFNLPLVRFIRGKFQRMREASGDARAQPGIGSLEVSNHLAMKKSDSITKISSGRLLKVLFAMPVFGVYVALNSTAIIGLNSLTIVEASADHGAPASNIGRARHRVGWIVTDNSKGTQVTAYHPQRNDHNNSIRYVGYEKYLQYNDRDDLPSPIEAFNSVRDDHKTHVLGFNGAERIYTLTGTDILEPALNNDVAFTGGTLVNSQSDYTLQSAATNPNPFDFNPDGRNFKLLADTNAKYYTIGENFKYGTWYIQYGRQILCRRLHTEKTAGFCRYFYFVPNQEEVAKLPANQVVRSRLNITYSLANVQYDRHFIVRLGRINNTNAEWTDGSEGIVRDLGPDGDIDLEGSITVSTRDTGTVSFAESSETNPAGEIKNFTPTTSLRTADVITGAEFPGDETVVGEDFAYGKWIIERQANYSAAGISTFKVRFRPDFEGVNSIPIGETATSKLSMIGPSFTRSVLTATIRGRHAPVVSFLNNRRSVVENADSIPGRLVVSSSVKPPSNKINVNYTLTNSVGNFFTGTAQNTATVDFLQASVPNSGSARYYGFIDVPIENNDVDNRVGIIQARLTDGSGYIVSGTNHTTVLEVVNDDISVISIARVAGGSDYTEGTGSGPAFTISSNLERTVGKNINVYYSVNQGDHDFVSESSLGAGKFVTLPAGIATLTTRLVVGIIDDEVSEDAGNVIVNLQLDPSDSNAYSINPDSSFATFQVIDDEPLSAGNIGLSVADATPVQEGAAGTTTNLVFRVNLTEVAPPGGIPYSWSTSDGTATDADGDYVPVSSGRGSVDADEDRDTFSVRVNGDGKFELSETLTVTVTTAAADVTITRGTAVGTIENDDAEPRPTISIAGISEITEGAGANAVFTVSADSVRAGSKNIYYTVDQGSNDFVSSAFLGSGKYVVLPAGDASVTAYLVVGIEDDSVPETSGNVTVTLVQDPSNAQSYDLSQTSKSVTFQVADNDTLATGAIGLSVADAAPVQEGAAGATTNMVFTVRLTEAAPAGGVSYSWSTADGTATVADGDYVAVSSRTGLVAAGEDEGTFMVEVNGDGKFEPSETVTVTVTSTAANVLISRGTAEGTIENDDSLAPGTIGLSVADATPVREGAAGATTNMVFTVRLTENAPAGGVSYSWSTADGTATIADSDYVAVSNGSGLVAAGEDEGTFIVEVNGDDKIESNETLTVTVSSSAANVTVTRGTATGRITNDDVPEVSIVADSDNVTEGAAATFTVSTVSAVDSDLRVAVLATAEGNFFKFGVPSGATIPANSSSATYTVQTTADPKTNQPGSITLRIASSNSYTVNENQMPVMTRIDDDGAQPPTVEYSVAASVITSILLSIPETQPSPPGTGRSGGNAGEISEISIFAEASSVEEGSNAKFELRIDPAAAGALSVAISVEDIGNRISNGHANRKRVSVSAGTSAVPLEFPTENDDHAGENSVISVSIEGGIGYAVDAANGSAAITVNDVEDRERRSGQFAAASQEALPHLFGVVGLESLGETSRRLQTAFDADRNSSLTIAGQSTIEGILHTGAEALDQDALAKDRLFWDESEFSIAVGPDYFGSSMATVWGGGNFTQFAEQGREARIDSGILTRQLGIDARLAPGTVAGITAFVSESDSTLVSDRIEDLEFTGETTGMHSYLGWKSGNGASQIDVISGFGANDLAIDQPGYDRESFENSFYTVYAGGGTTLLTFDGLFDNSTVDLKSNGRFWMNRHLSADISNLASDLNLDSHHALFAASGSGSREFANGDRMSLLLSLGLRNDGKGQNAANALEAFTRIEYVGQYGLTLSGSTGLVQFQGSDSQSLELKGALDFDRGADRLGNIAKVAAVLNPVSGEKSDLIWSSNELVGNIGSSSSSSNSAAKTLESEFGYGIAVWDRQAVLTPYGGMQLDGLGSSKYLVGSRLAAGSNHSFELEGAYHEPENNRADFRVGLDGKVRW